MAKMSDREVKAILQAEKRDALAGMNASELADQRQKAMEYYQGEMLDLPAPKDRSHAVSTDVADTVEGLMPSLMEIFCGGEEVVEFAPVGPDDEEKAEQETDYINHVAMQKNAGFLILYSFFKDALLSKVGVVKVFWEEKEEEIKETFWGLSDIEFGMKRLDEKAGLIEIVEHTERMGMPGQQPQEEQAYA